MFAVRFVLLSASIALAQPPSPEQTRGVLARLEREADRFDRNAHRFTGIETLRQVQPPGTRYSTGPSGVATNLPESVHEIVSEYAYVSTDERGGPLKEVRLVLTVDGLKWKHGKKDLNNLANQIATRDSKNRTKMLESYEAFGLRGFLSDCGQLILLFAHGGVEKYEFTYERTDGFGTGPLWVYRYQQLDGGDAFTIYGEKQPIRQRLQGEIWVQPSDGVPVRVTIDSNHATKYGQVRDLTLVDYDMTRWNLLLPAHIDHRQYVDNRLFVIDEFSYSDFKQNTPGPLR